MSTQTRPLQPWQIRDDEARQRFERDTAGHQMTVLHDDGLYRHLRFKHPDNGFYWYDLVTWPGHLTICGDMDTFTFARIKDMFEFFHQMHGGINADYWSEKLQGPRRGRDLAKSYSSEKYRARVNEWVEYVTKDMSADEAAALREAVSDRLFNDWSGWEYSEEIARGLLHEFDHDGRQVYDPSDWDLREYDSVFLWCLWAIVRGIEQYRAAGGSREKAAA